MTEISIEGVALAPVVVERVALRIARRHRRIGRMVLAAGISMPLVSLLYIGAGMIFVRTMAVGGVMLGMMVSVYVQRRALRRHAEQVAEAAASGRELDWVYRAGAIRALDHGQAQPLLELAVKRSIVDREPGLPVARLVSRTARQFAASSTPPDTER
jgi:hypothetical protein